MRIVILTQDENYSIPAFLKVLFDNLSEQDQVVACFFLDSLPVGLKKKTKGAQWQNLFNTFGYWRMLKYAVLEIKLRLFGKTIRKQLKKHSVPLKELKKGVNHSDSLKKIAKYKPDLILSIGTYQIFKKDLIDLPKIGVLNYHEALLPLYRGVLPAFWVIKNNEKFTGVSLFLVDHGVDTGNIVVQKKHAIPEGISHMGLLSELKVLGAAATIEAFDKLRSGSFKDFIKQKGEGSYYTWPTRAEIEEFEKEGKKLI